MQTLPYSLLVTILSYPALIGGREASERDVTCYLNAYTGVDDCTITLRCPRSENPSTTIAIEMAA